MRTTLLVTLAILSVGYIIIGVFSGERWLAPNDELKTLLKFYSELATAEDTHFDSHGTYADFDRIVGTGTGRSRVQSRCQAGYCFEVRGDGRKYTIRILPDRTSSRSGLMSLYADETRVIRVAYGQPIADASSAVLSQEEVRRFWPK
jgi:hypothetical protein